MLSSTATQTPSPLVYNIESGFQKRPKSRAYTFGMSREFFNKVYLKENPPKDPSVPGPGQYSVKKEYTEKTPSKFSLRPKTAKDHSFQNYTKFVPGPGAYQITASDSKNGYIMNSRYKSGGSIVISNGTKRFASNMRGSLLVPGPGNYQPKLDLDKKGNYSFYRYRNSGAPVFTKAGRDTNLDNSATRKSKFNSFKIN